MSFPTGQWTKLQQLIFFGILVCTVMDRALFVGAFGVRYTGSDDVIFWMVAVDLANGILREPFLYGQNYNAPLESMAAVPLLWAQIPLHVAMPIVTSLLALAPFVAFGSRCAMERQYAQASLWVAIPLFLPVEWNIMTTITRGFVNGLAILALLPVLLMVRPDRTRSIGIGACLMAALIVNPNVLLFAAPFALWYLIRDIKERSSIFWMMLGAAPLVAFQRWAFLFYAKGPERIVHRIDDWRLNFAPSDLLPEAIGQLDLHFAWMCPFVWDHGEAILLILSIPIIVLAAQRRKWSGIALTSVYPLIVLSLCYPKTQDGFDSPFYAFSRVFLAMPILLAWAAELPKWSIPVSRITSALLMVAAPAVVLIKKDRTPQIVDESIKSALQTPVREYPVVEFHHAAEQLGTLCAIHRVDLIIGLDKPFSQFSQLQCYGSPLIISGLPPTLYAGKDRRIWQRLAVQDTRPGTILIIGGDELIWQRAMAMNSDIERLQGLQPMLHLVRHNTRTMREIGDLLEHEIP